MLRRFFYLIPCFLLCCAVHASASSNVLSGYIVNEQNEPLSGATILILQLNKGAVSDHEGFFRIEDVPDGDWTLLFRYVGFASKELHLDLPEDKRQTMRVTLSQDIFQADEMQIVGSIYQRISRYQPTQSYLSRDIIQRNTSSIGTLLDGESGVAMRSMGNAPSRPVVRGMDGERIQVLQNGMKMGDFSATGHDHAVILDPMSIDQVDIVRGASSLIYGSSAMGGIVNVHSQDIPNNWSPGISGYAGAEGQTGMESIAVSGRMTYGSDNSAFSFRSNIRHTGNMQTPAGEIPDTDLISYGFATGGAWKNRNGYSGLSLQFMDLAYGIPEDPQETDEEIEVTMTRFAVQGQTHRLLNHSFWKAAEIRLVYNYYTQEEREYEYVNGVMDGMDIELAIDHHYFQTDVLFQHGSRGWLDNGTIGLTFAYRDVEVGGDEALTPDATGWTTAGFVVEEMTIGAGWRFQTGIRLEWNHITSHANEDYPLAGETRSQGIWAASAGISGPLFNTIQAGFQLSRSHRTPSLEELFADAIHFAAGAHEVGNSNLNDEIGYGVDLFTDVNGRFLDIHLALFAKRINNYISLRPTGRFEPTRNYPILEYIGADADLYGFEFSATQTITENWHVAFNGDYIRGTERYDGNRNPLPYMPPMRFSISSTYDKGLWWGHVRVRHALKQDRIADNEEATDRYTLTETAIGLRLGTTNLHHVSLSVENIFDVTWRDHLSRIEQRDIPMMGRNIRLAYRYYF